MNDDTWVWVAVVVAVLALLALLAWFLLRRRSEQQRTQALRERFGPEYDRRVQESGDERAAREHLSQVQERRDQLEIRDLAPAARDRYLQRWQAVQTDFVDRPGHAVDEADTIVSEVMRERGYPVDDSGTRSDMLAADHPQVMDEYRAATDARSRHHDEEDTASTEELRRAMVHYRSLFERLVGDSATGSTTDGPADTAAQRRDDGGQRPMPVAPDDETSHGRHAAAGTPDTTPADAGDQADAGHQRDTGDPVDAGHHADAGDQADAGHQPDTGPHENTSQPDTVDLREHETRSGPRG